MATAQNDRADRERLHTSIDQALCREIRRMTTAARAAPLLATKVQVKGHLKLLQEHLHQHRLNFYPFVLGEAA